MQRFHDGQRVLVKKDEDDKAVNTHGNVTRICTDGERAWVLLDDPKGGPGTAKVRAYPEDCEPADVEGVEETEEPAPTIGLFGRDHWSTFAYIETRIVDFGGTPNRAHMRCHAKRHPLMLAENGDGSAYPTRLKGEATLKYHDDWDCIDDLARAGLLVNVGSGIDPKYKLTPIGQDMASRLRVHLSTGGACATFSPVEV